MPLTATYFDKCLVEKYASVSSIDAERRLLMADNYNYTT